MAWISAKQDGNSVWGYKDNNNKYHVCHGKLIGFTSTGITVEVNGQVRVYDENGNWKATN